MGDAWTLRVRGIAPHANTTLTLPDTSAAVIGPSGSGKSTLIEASLLALAGAGSDREPSTSATVATPIAPGRIAGVAEVSITTPSGTEIAWRMASGGRPSRTLRRAGGPLVSDDAEIRREMGAAGDRDLVAAVMTPMWLLDRLAMPAAAARPARDLLSRVLVGDRLTTYLAARLQPGEPTARKAAEAAATTARREADRAAGALQALTGDPDTEPQRPDPDRVAAARSAQAAHATAMQRHHEEVGRLGAAPDVAAAERSARAWDVRRAGLARPAAPRPDGDIGALLQRRDALRAARTVRAAVDADMRAAGLIERVPCGGAVLMSDTLDIDCSACPLLAAAQEARGRIPAELPPDVSPADVDAAGAAVEAAQAWLAYDAALAQLGERPVVPVAVERPTAPTGAPWVGQVLEQAARAEAAHAAWTERQASRAARLLGAQQAADDVRAAAERASVVERIVRDAPGIVLDEVIGALATRAGLRITASPDSVSVAWRGIPWGCLSSGQRVAADAAFRDALRDVCDVAWLPLWVDDAQLATGDISLPGDDAGPVWVIRGAAPGDADAIRVEVSDA